MSSEAERCCRDQLNAHNAGIYLVDDAVKICPPPLPMFVRPPATTCTPASVRGAQHTAHGRLVVGTFGIDARTTCGAMARGCAWDGG